ncbi:MAG: hypothetical protein DRN99_04285 [Thermoproteota archaeon]|nr:MAG: hypothetical protein DRN99_04285 [Candidatus Korarchaeota archaeon]
MRRRARGEDIAAVEDVIAEYIVGKEPHGTVLRLPVEMLSWLTEVLGMQHVFTLCKTRRRTSPFYSIEFIACDACEEQTAEYIDIDTETGRIEYVCPGCKRELEEFRQKLRRYLNQRRPAP